KLLNGSEIWFGQSDEPLIPRCYEGVERMLLVPLQFVKRVDQRLNVIRHVFKYATNSGCVMNRASYVMVKLAIRLPVFITLKQIRDRVDQRPECRNSRLDARSSA